VKSAYLDTHTAVLLHTGIFEKLADEGRKQIETSNLLISPMVLVELEYLFKRKRIGVDARTLYTNLNADFGVEVCSIPFARIAWEATGIGWTQDPFDRLIVAQAATNNRAPLITRDRVIREHYNQAVW
jgi:PIN domain nuclease of toxin-antitoxin system